MKQRSVGGRDDRGRENEQGRRHRYGQYGHGRTRF